LMIKFLKQPWKIVRSMDISDVNSEWSMVNNKLIKK
jgi:hypothetical protein